jgi:hypothetical protein
LSLTERADVSGTRPAAAPEPFPSHTAADGAVVGCASCGQANPPGAQQCTRATCRKALKGNSLSRRHGLEAMNAGPEQQAIDAAGCALVEQSVTDAGGREELSARELSDHQYRGLLHVRILKLAHALQAHGEFDRRGRLRKGWIELLDRLITSAVAIDKTLGLPRKAKPVQSATDIIREFDARKAREAQQP